MPLLCLSEVLTREAAKIRILNSFLSLQEEEAKRRMDLERIMEENQKKIEDQQKKMVSHNFIVMLVFGTVPYLVLFFFFNFRTYSNFSL
jgi:uncharacterized membrane protein (DUF106 family)